MQMQKQMQQVEEHAVESVALVVAAKNGDIKECARLLGEDGGADVNQAGQEGRTALMLASLAGNLELVKLLLAHGARVELKSMAGKRALDAAAAAGHLDVCAALIDAGTDVNEKRDMTALHAAVATKRPDVCKLLVTKGADIEARIVVDGATPLIIAASVGCPEIVDILVEAGADLGAVNNMGRSALHAAARNAAVALRIIAAIRALAPPSRSRLILDKQDVNGGTPLHIAAATTNYATCAMLIEAGCDVNIKDTDGRAPIVEVALCGDERILDLFARAHADIACISGPQFASIVGEQTRMRLMALGATSNGDIPAGADFSNMGIGVFPLSAMPAAGLVGRQEFLNFLVQQCTRGAAPVTKPF